MADRSTTCPECGATRWFAFSGVTHYPDDCREIANLKDELDRLRRERDEAKDKNVWHGRMIEAQKERHALRIRLQEAEKWANEQIDQNFVTRGAHSGYLSKREHFVPKWMGGER